MERSSAAQHPTELSLPTTVITVTDVKRLLREAKNAQEFMHQASLRKPGSYMKLPSSSLLLDKICEENGLSLLKADDRDRLLAELKKIDERAPVMHLSFASSPSDSFLQKIVSWFRKEIHPHTILQIGLQPSIAGGCTLRTRSKYFDFSLRQYLNQHQATLISEIKEARDS